MEFVMRFFLLGFSLLTCCLLGQEQWVQESVLFEKENGKTYILRIDEAIKAGGYDTVVELCDELISKVEKPANIARALVLKGDAVLNSDDKQAFEIYQVALEKYPVYINYGAVVKKQLVIANKQFEKIKGKDSFFLDRQPTIEYYKKIITNAPFAKNAAFLLLRVGMLQREDDQDEEAIQSYRTLVKRYRTSPEAGYARVNLAQYYLNLLDKIDGDQRLVDEAKSQLILFTQQFTKHEMLGEAKSKLSKIYNIEAERLYLLAVFYNRKETPHYRPAASKRYLYKLLITYGDSDFVNQSKTLLATLENSKEGLNQAVLQAEKEEELERIILPPEATDKTLRKVVIKQGESDKFLLAIRHLDLTPLENSKSGTESVVKKPVIETPIVKPVIKKPVIETPIVKPVIKKPVVKTPVIETPIVKPVIKKPVVKTPVIEKPIVKPVIKKPVVKTPVIEKPIVKPVIKKPIVKTPVIEKPIVKPVIKKPVVKPVIKKPVVKPVVKKPVDKTKYIGGFAEGYKLPIKDLEKK
jgi:outer membrane protein assembly factor BamD (BamD/ComL family)